MPRAARPSDVYRLPEQTRSAPRTSEPPPEPPGRRFPAWLGVAGLLAAGLIIAGVVRGANEPAPGNVPLVDVVSEDQAIAVLRLYGAQVSTIDDLRARTDIYATPGPADAMGVAQRGAQAAARARDDVREMGNLDPLAAAYANSDEHPRVTAQLDSTAALAEAIAFLASTHDTLYSGAGSISLQDAQNRLTSMSNTRTPAAIDAWTNALLDQLEDRNRAQEAIEAREASRQLWEQQVMALQPAAVAELQTYITGLPAVTVDGLRGHPVAGPPLRRLEEHSRQVSG